MMQGIVKWFNSARGFGFITPADGTTEIFVHYSEIAGNGFKTLHDNQQVEYEIGYGVTGPQARNVRTL
ncbi:cold shock domain-containing protein [Rhodococcus artemisiae]|uniref:Cold-shock protein n=1 Tax=Rhodococcus artemisiae TaxID=714159 RepID=A0ABU7LGJ3_9NOCA|nr:cold-shock protein [Rhodococcus artemisiae]MEE2060680.1 cold-shock protein [Rhodococcus artemisiae]